MLTKLAVETALNAELTDHIGHEKNAPKTGSNTRNGYSSKTLLCDDGEIDISTSRDRESTNGLYKADMRKTRQNVELVTLKWVDWYNNHRLMERTGYIPPVEAEKAYYASLNDRDVAA